MRKIGIMGGTFNPIHNGHLMLAQKSYEQYRMERILVMPDKLPLYKDTNVLPDARYRSEMVRLAIAPYPYMEFSDLELKRPGATYTVDTLLELTGRYPNDRFYFILGGDSLLHFQEWSRYRRLLELTVILCAPRAGADMDALEEARRQLLLESPDAEIAFLDAPLLDISSTDIRNKIAAGNPEVRTYLPDTVWKYIQEMQLYQSGEQEAREEGR